MISLDEVVSLKYNKHTMHKPLAKVMAGKNMVLEAIFQKLGELNS